MSAPASDDAAGRPPAARTGAGRLTEALDELERYRSVDVDVRLARARDLENQALDAGDAVAAMRARLVAADMLHRVGRRDEGAALAVGVNDWAAANGPQSLLARSHLVLSSVFESIGDVASGLDHAVRALDVLGDEVAPRDLGNYVLRLADALAVSGDADREQARQRYRQAEEIFLALEDRDMLLVVLNNRAMLEYEAGDVDAAVAVTRELREATGDGGLDAATADTVGRVLLAAGRLDDAERAVRDGYRLLAELGDVQAVTPAELALTLSEVLLAAGRIEAAQDELDRCLAVCLERELNGVRVDALRVRAEILAARGLHEDAYRAHQRFHAEWVALRSSQQEAAARTRQALFETAEARRAAQRFWEQARTDPLTDLPNRRYVDEELPLYLVETARRGLVLVAGIVDADHFKQVNDRFSHDVGDHVLRRLGAMLAAAVRGGIPGGPPGFAARLGGEEFLVVLVGAEPQVAAARVDALRRAVEAQDWDDVEASLRVTVSAGVTVARPGDTQSALLSRADANLYRAKESGRNRVVGDDA